MPEHFKDLPEEQQRLVESAMEQAKRGPGVLVRRGGKATRPWTPPTHVVIDVPGVGPAQVHIETGAVYEPDANDEEKLRLQEAAKERDKVDSE